MTEKLKDLKINFDYLPQFLLIKVVARPSRPQRPVRPIR
jgi:hypothetical protein